MIAELARKVRQSLVDKLAPYVNTEQLFLEWFEDEYAEFEVICSKIILFKSNIISGKSRKTRRDWLRAAASPSEYCHVRTASAQTTAQWVRGENSNCKCYCYFYCVNPEGSSC